MAAPSACAPTSLLLSPFRSSPVGSHPIASSGGYGSFGRVAGRTLRRPAGERGYPRDHELHRNCRVDRHEASDTSGRDHSPRNQTRAYQRSRPRRRSHGARRTHAKTPARERRAKSARTTPIKLTPETLERLLAATNGDGIPTSALAERATAKQDQVLALLRELEARGTVRRTGQRRGTRWHLITDDDRIAARAAELERTE